MKKWIVAMLAIAVLSVGSRDARADVVFDAFSGTTAFTTTGSVPRRLLADGATSLAALLPGQHWELNRVEFGMFVFGANSFASGQIGFELRFFDSFTPLTTTSVPVMGNPQGTVTGAFGAFSTTGNTVFTTSIPFPAIALNTNQPTLGWTLRFLNNGAPTEVVVAAFRDGAATTGTSPHGFYRDAEAPTGNGVINGSDWRFFTGQTNTNMTIAFHGNAVPEPGVAVILGLGGLVGLCIRRRR